MAGPLSNATILDLTQHIAGPFATKLLADHGADVIKIEAPGGDPARKLGPFKDGTPHPERSGTFFYLNTNKRSVVLDLKTDAGRAALFRLLERADAVVENFRPGVIDALGIGGDELQRRKPSVCVVSISNFGQTGPYREYRASDLTMYGFAGEMYAIGVSQREPVKMFGTASLIESGAGAATAIMGALFSAKRNGVGEYVDFSLMESHFSGVDRRHASAIGWEFGRRKTLRPGQAAAGMANGVYPCADGYVDFNSANLRMDRVTNMLGNPDWLTGPKWKVVNAHLDPALIEEFNENFYAWLMVRTKHEVWEEARGSKVLCAPLFTIEELINDPHFRERGFWQEVEHAEMGSVTIPGRPFIMTKTPYEIRRAPPLLGGHTVEVLTEAGLTPAEIAAATGRVEATA